MIVDDGSTDPKLLQHMENYNKDPRVKLVTNAKNSGIAHSLNVGFQVAKDIPGVQYIARMDSDDICFKDRILAQVNFMELNPSIDICGTSMIVLRQNSEPRVITMPSYDPIIRYNMAFYCCLGHPTVMFKASRIKLIQYSLQDTDMIEDYELWLRLCLTTQLKFANMGQVLVCLRKHMDNQSTGVPIEAEIPLKIRYLSTLLESNSALSMMIQEIPLITEEFIRVTGRPVRADTFSNIKHRKDIDAIFQQMIMQNKKREVKNDLDKVVSEFITRSLEDRKHELSIHCVGQNCDVDALRGLIESKNPSNSGMSQLKKMLMGSGPSAQKPHPR